MLSSDFRKIAREKLTGKWGKAVCMVLAYLFFSYLLSLLENLFSGGLLSLIISIGVLLIEIPLSFGFVFAFFGLFYDEDVKAFSFWNLGFNNFSRAWGVTFHTTLKLIAPILLIIVSYILIGVSISYSLMPSILLQSSSSDAGSSFFIIIAFGLLIFSVIWAILKSYYYSLAQFVAFDNPYLSPKECVEKSRELMTNRRANLFYLQFSFIGWIILAGFTFGIGLLWILPYFQMATIAFYDNFVNKENKD